MPTVDHTSVLVARNGVDSELTVIRRAGKAAMTAATNTRVIITGGLVGSVLNMWWISWSFPYRNGLACDGSGEAGSCSIVRSKAGLLYGFDDPNEAMINDAESGVEEERRGIGMSFCV